MWHFWIRLIIFVGLWVWVTINQSAEFGVAISLFLLAGSLVPFFLLSKGRTSIYIFLILGSLMMLHGYLLGDRLFTALLLLFLLILACARLQKTPFYLFLGLSDLILILLAWQNEAVFYFWLVLIAFFSYLLVELAGKKRQETEAKNLYEGLLAEYRQLKRIHVSQAQIAKAEERTRIAREIHDSVGHRLTALMMKIEMLYIQTKSEDLVELKALANDSLQETRDAVKALEATEANGLAGIVQLIRKLEAESQLLIAFTMKEGALSIELTGEQGAVLYRAMQEALTNVMRHSDSKTVQIEIGRAPVAGITFTVSNPYKAVSRYKEGFGIRNMKERFREAGGKLTVYQTDKAFILEGMIPLVKEGTTDVAHYDRG